MPRVYNKKKSRLPSRPEEWTKLMRKVIATAKSRKDRRLPGLQHALANDRSEAHLRSLSIVTDADIEREFPAR